MRLNLDPNAVVGGGGGSAATATAAPAGGGTVLGGSATTPPAAASAATQSSWLDSLPPEYRDNTMFRSIPDLPTLAKNYENAQRLIGTKRMEEPQPTWAPEKWNEFYGKLGRPETPDKYTVPTIKLEGGHELNPDLVKEAQSKLHSAGLTDKQFQAVMSLYGETTNKGLAASKVSSEQARTAAEQALKQEFGDRYTVKVDLAKAALRKFGDESLVGYLNESGLGNDPRLIKLLASVSEGMMEDRTHLRTQGLNITGTTAAAQELEGLKMDPEFQKALFDGQNPGHKAALDRWMSLHQVAFPGKQPDEF